MKVGYAATRVLTIILGALAIGWGVVTFPYFLHGSVIENLGRQVVRGEPFKTDVLVQQIPILDAAERQSFCQASVLQADAVVRLRLAEDAIDQGDRLSIDERIESLRAVIRKSLSCSPADAFLWLVLSWVEGTASGFSGRNFDYLRMSYQQGRNEGWIAIKRNRALLAMHAQLPDDLAELAVAEFVRIVGSKLFLEAADILTGPGWPVRNILLARLEPLPLGDREQFAKLLQARGLDLTVPGVSRPSTPPRF